MCASIKHQTRADAPRAHHQWHYAAWPQRVKPSAPWPEKEDTKRKSSQCTKRCPHDSRSRIRATESAVISWILSFSWCPSLCLDLDSMKFGPILKYETRWHWRGIHMITYNTSKIYAHVFFWGKNQSKK